MSRSRIAAVLLLFAGSSAVAADERIEPFYTFNKSPLVQIFGLPAPESSVLPSAHQQSRALVLDVSNSYFNGKNADEALRIDAESYRAALVWRAGLGGGFAWGIDLPYVAHRGGFLDHTIYQFHDLFNLPQGGRQGAHDNQMLIRYQRHGATVFSFDRESAGLGDVRLVGARQLGPASALHVTLKLPTGDSRGLLGSGATDFALALSGQRAAAEADYFGSVGVLALGRGDVLPDQQEHVVGFSSAGVAWMPAGWPVLQAQIDAHTAFYDDSNLVALGKNALTLTFGVRSRLSRRTRIEFAVVEDLYVGSAPDVTFQLRLSSRY